MIRLLTIVGSLCLFISSVFAQPVVEVSYEKDNAGTYTFYGQNNDVCPYTLVVDFTTLVGLRSSSTLPYTGDIRPGRNALFRLQPFPNQVSSFQYTIRYIKGCARPRIDTSVVCLLPVKPGNKVSAAELDYLGKVYAGEAPRKDWYALALKMNSGDTVFAARRGTVSAVRNDAVVTGSGLSFNRNDNFVEISHQDCSFASYTVFRPNGIFVRPGQFVEAGTPLGLVGGEGYAFGPHVRFSVHCNYEAPVVKNGQRTDQKNYWAYVPLRFWLGDTQKAGKLEPRTTYVSAHPDALVVQEMSKRDLKSWQKKHAK